MKITAVIVTYNGMTWIQKCLDSMLNSSVPIDIVIIDNKSSDDTVAYITANYSDIKLFQPNSNLGFGKANNIGLKYAIDNGADYVFLLNQDAWVEVGTVEGLVSLHQLNKEYGILSPIQMNGRGTALDGNFAQVCNTKSCPAFISDLYTRTIKEIYPINFVMAAIWLIPREVILKAGVFDPIFPHYGEDADYIRRIFFHGYKVGICPSYIGFHDREERPSSAKKIRTLKYLGYITNLKDINKSLPSVLVQFVFLWIEKSMRPLSKLHIIGFYNEIVDGLKIIFIIPQIIKHRNICKEESAFLNAVN